MNFDPASMRESLRKVGMSEQEIQQIVSAINKPRSPGRPKYYPNTVSYPIRVRQSQEAWDMIDEYIDKGNFKSRPDFINEAVQQLLERLGDDTPESER